MIWRSVVVAGSVAGVVVLGVLLAIGEWGCCGAGVAKPLSGDSTWLRPPSPGVVGGAAAIPGPAGKANRKSKGKDDSGDLATTPLSLLSTLKPAGKRKQPSPPNDTTPIADTSPPETPLPPDGSSPTPGVTPPADNCSVIDVLTGLAPTGCPQAVSASGDSSNDDDSSGNNDSSHRHDSSHDNDSSDGSDGGGNDDGGKGKGKGQGRGRAVGNKHR